MEKLKAGYGQKRITPQLGINLGGYGFYLNRQATSILDDLKVRVLLLKEGQERVILISCDLLGLTVEFSDTIKQEIASVFKIASQNILVACTHTHSGPVTQPLIGLGDMDLTYMANVKKEIIEAVGLAEDGCKFTKFSFSFEAIEAIGFNRRKGNFEDIDPVLKMAVFKQEAESLLENNKDLFFFPIFSRNRKNPCKGK